MDWIESHRSLASHPKTKRLARTLDISIPQAVGHLHLFWWFVAEYAFDGDLTRFDPGDVADGAMWEGDPEAFLPALIAARFVDAPGAVHNWDQYVARYLKGQQAAALGNHKRWHDGRGVKDPECPLCRASFNGGESGATPTDDPPRIVPQTPHDSSRSDPPRVGGDIGGESADLNRPDQTRPDPADLTRPEDQDRKARGAPAPASEAPVGTPLGEVLGSSPPKVAPGLSVLEDGLVAGLKELDPVWRKLSFSAVNRLNKAFGRPVVVAALQRCREEKAVPAEPFPFLQAICAEIKRKEADRASAAAT